MGIFFSRFEFKSTLLWLLVANLEDKELSTSMGLHNLFLFKLLLFPDISHDSPGDPMVPSYIPTIPLDIPVVPPEVPMIPPDSPHDSP